MNISIFSSYFELCKPRIVALMLLTSTVGILMAGSPYPWNAIVFANIGIALCASAAAVINHIIDRKIDEQMSRTQNRPLVKKKISTLNAISFSCVLTVTGIATLLFFVNELTAILTLTALIGYAIIYTRFLKRITTQNIVIGGLAGAMPPLLGWVAVTNSIDAHAWLLVLIIFLWTPPHFWALAIAKKDEYAKTNIPMFPVIYGNNLTSLHVFLYSMLTIVATFLPYLTNMSGELYLLVVTIINIRLFILSWKLWRNSQNKIIGMQLFWYSIHYLMILFIALLIDKYFIPTLDLFI